MLPLLVVNDLSSSTFDWATMLARGGVVSAVLLLASVLVLAVVLDRWRALRLGARPEEFLAGLAPFLEFGDRARALQHCQGKGAVGRMAAAGVRAWGAPAEALEDALWRQRQLEVLNWESRLPLLGTVGSTAPFVGLFGTVIGIVRAFQALSANQSGGPGVVAEGISEALVTTAAGLLVAIPAVVAFNLLSRKVRVIRIRLDLLGSELAGMLASHPVREPGSRD